VVLQREFIAALYQRRNNRERKPFVNREHKTHVCRNCGKRFVFHHYNDAYCSDRCRKIFQSANDEKKAWKVRRIIRNYRMANEQRAPFEESLELSLTDVRADINDFARVDWVDFDIQDVLHLIERDGVLQGKVPYMGAPQDEAAALISMLERFIDERADPELVEKFKQDIEANQGIARKYKREPKPEPTRYASEELAKIKAKYK